MLKDPTAFRNRFRLWKETGESQYEAGLPKYNDGEEPKSMFDVINRAVRYIGQHEGFVDHVYGDRFASQEIAKKHGYWSDKYQKWLLPTAGYGWTSKEDLHSWTKEQADERLAKDIKKYFEDLAKRYPTFKDLPPERQIALADLYHQAGPNWKVRMPKLHAALLRGDKDAGKYLSFASHQTKNRNDDRIALWNDPMGYRQKERRQLGKQFAKEKTTHVEPVDFYKQRRQLQPVEMAFDIDVPESISLKNTFDTPAQKAIKAIDNQIALSRLVKSMSMEDLNPLSSITQKDIINDQVFTNLIIPQIMGQ